MSANCVSPNRNEMSVVLGDRSGRHPGSQSRRRLPWLLVDRLARLYVGLTLFGASLALMIEARFGLGPWDVLHQGIARRLGVQIGWIVIGVGALALLAWIPLGERPGIGTVSNVIMVGLVLNVALNILPSPDTAGIRLLFLATGIVLNGAATGLYIGAGLGPGPRDGLMTGLSRRGHSVGRVRTALEAGVLIIGVVLGGTVGIGTIAYAISIGPLVQYFLPRLATGTTPATHAGREDQPQEVS